MAWIISTTSPDMIYEEEVWQRFSPRGKILTMRRIICWNWGYVVVDHEPSTEELNSDEGFDVEAALPIDRDFGECWYFWEEVDGRTNRLVESIDDLDQLIIALKDLGWRLAEKHITMFGVLQKAKTRRKPKRLTSLKNFDLVLH